MHKRGDFGVGTLIIFLAMLLVGAVAAGVLIMTTMGTQQAALATGQEAEEELVTVARIQEMSGTNGADGTVENLSILLKLVPGSNPIKFESAIVQISTDTFTTFTAYEARLNSSAYCAVGNVTYTAPNCMNLASDRGSGTYTIEYTRENNNHLDGVLGKGETVRVHIALNTTLESGEYVRVLFTPNYGTPDLLETHMPDAFGERNVGIYP